MKITTNYHENILQNQLNLNKKSTIKKIRILASRDGECSKIMRVKLVNRWFGNGGEGKRRVNGNVGDGDERNVSNSNNNMNMRSSLMIARS